MTTTLRRLSSPFAAVLGELSTTREQAAVITKHFPEFDALAVIIPDKPYRRNEGMRKHCQVVTFVRTPTNPKGTCNLRFHISLKCAVASLAGTMKGGVVNYIAIDPIQTVVDRAAAVVGWKLEGDLPEPSETPTEPPAA